jgi:hypothetical protein
MTQTPPLVLKHTLTSLEFSWNRHTDPLLINTVTFPLIFTYIDPSSVNFHTFFIWTAKLYQSQTNPLKERRIRAREKQNTGPEILYITGEKQKKKLPKADEAQPLPAGKTNTIKTA